MNVNSNTVPRPSREQIAEAKRTMNSVQWWEFSADLKINDILRLSQKHNVDPLVAQRVLRDMERSGGL